MYGFLIVGIVFSFLTISSFLEYSSKKDRQKIEAALRMEEMRRGYAPGTYSYKFSKKNKTKYKAKDFKGFNKDFVDEEIDSRSKERANLKNGIDDLMTRINNLETIMKADEKDE
jgi:hypothetical protein